MNKWVEIRLGDIATITRGGSPRPIYQYLTEGDGLNWLRIGDVPKESKYIGRAGSKIRREGLSKTTYVHRGDFILSNSMSFGRPYIMDMDSCIHDGWLALKKLDRSKIDPVFLYYLLLHPKTQYIFRAWSAGSGVLNLKKATVQEVRVCVPGLQEQKRIVAISEIWDQYLENLDEKIEIKKDIKKGLMQQIFSQKIRFRGKNGDDYPDWQECRLGDIAFKESSSISAEGIKGRSGPYSVYGASGFLQSLDMYDQETEYIAIVKDGAGVGRLMLLEPKSSVLGTLNIIKPKNVGVRFLYYLLQTVNFERYIAGSTIPHIYFRDYSRARLRIPNREEQEKIQEVLFLLDEQVSHLEDKRDTIDKQRKYLLNNLVGGKIRVPSGSGKAGNNA